MPIETQTDLAALLNTPEFGTAASYTPATGGEPNPLNGIFDNPHILVDFGASVPTSGSRATFLCRSADLPPDARGGDIGDMLTISAMTYRVVDLQPDGTGLTLIVLGM